ncbi:MAG TPA: hypothetical protein VFG31_06335 [Conexibacter sp.]|nr:hypothetical protein [Conexibacter sp.]
MPRPELWRQLVAAGAAPAHAEHGFRAAVYEAQRRSAFPDLPRAKTGPAAGTTWSEDRLAAELARHREATVYELYTTRASECRALLRNLAGIVTVTLTPRAFAILARNGYGADMVLHAVRMLQRAGLAEVRWTTHGIDTVPVVEKRCA